MSSLLSLPVELLVDILGLLSFLDLLRCQAISRKFDHIVTTSAKLQYIIELDVAGYVDGAPSHPFNTFQRFNYIKARQDEWKNPDLEVIKTVPLQGHCLQWELQAGIFMRAISTKKYGPAGFDTVQTLQLKPTIEDLQERTLSLASAFNGIEFDPGPGLLVLFDRYPRAPCTFVEILLLSLRTGLPHQSAITPCLRIPFVCINSLIGNMGIKIWDELLVLHLFDEQVQIHFINWRSGTIFATMPDHNPALRVTSLCRLSKERFAALTYSFDTAPQMYLLDVFELDLTNTRCDSAQTPNHLARYQFPKMNFERPPLSIITSSFPGHPSPHPDGYQAMPCHAAPSSGLICIRILPREVLPALGCQIFILPTPFLTVGANPDGTPAFYPWSSWGPPITRWIKDGARHISLGIKPYAYRIAGPGRILDFNPHDIARDLCRRANLSSPPNDEGPGQSEIITQATIICSDDHFKENVTSSLAFRETIYEIPDDIRPSAICFVEEDFYCIGLEGFLNPTALYICSI